LRPQARRFASRFIAVKPQGRDWVPLIVLAVAGSVAVAGACFLGGYAVGYARSHGR